MPDELRALTDLPTLEELLRTGGFDVLKARLEEALAHLPSDGPYAVYRRHEYTPCAHFPDSLESTCFLPGGLLVGKGRQDFGALYLLRIHDPSIPLKG